MARLTLLALLVSLAAATPVRHARMPSARVTDAPSASVDPAVAAREKLHLGTAIGGALDLPTTITHPWGAAATGFRPANDAWAAEITVTVINNHGAPVSTVHVNGAGPTPIGNPGAGVMPVNGTDSFIIPAGWNGNVAVNDAAFSCTTGDESLIEGSFVDQGQGYAQGDINISYV